jgi:hypothetical protein
MRLADAPHERTPIRLQRVATNGHDVAHCTARRGYLGNAALIAMPYEDHACRRSLAAVTRLHEIH